MSQERTILEGKIASPDEKFWLSQIREIKKGEIQKTEEAAKQLITLTTLSQTIYFAAVSFSEAKKSLEILKTSPSLYIGFIILLILPLFPWFISLYSAIEVFKPKNYETNLNSPTSAEETLGIVNSNKTSSLDLAYFLLKIGFIFAFVTLFVYLVFVPISPEK